MKNYSLLYILCLNMCDHLRQKTQSDESFEKTEMKSMLTLFKLLRSTSGRKSYFKQRETNFFPQQNLFWVKYNVSKTLTWKNKH